MAKLLKLYFSFVFCLLIGEFVQCKIQQNAFLSLSDELLLEKSCRMSLQEGACKCVYKWAGSRCCCVGEKIEAVPTDLPDRMTTLFLYNTSIRHIDTSVFQNYFNIESFHINLSYKLKTLNGSVFEHMQRLHKIFISNCPELTEITGTLLHKNHRLQSVTISNNPKLENVPEMVMNEHHRLTIDLFDLSGNAFKTLPSGRIRGVFAQNALFIGNQLERIESNAFQHCQFIKLNFSYNSELKKVESNAFSGILSLKELDLSGSQITELPVIGLKKTRKASIAPCSNSQENAVRYATREFERDGGGEFKSHYKEIQQRVCNREKTSMGEKFIRRKRQWDSSEFGSDKNGTFDFMVWLDELSDVNLPNLSEEEEKCKLFNFFIKPITILAFSGDELGKSIVIQRCVDTAVANFYLNITCTPQPDALNPCEDIVSYPTLRFFLWPMCIIALLGNISVWIIIAAVWQKRLRYHYFFMLNLSVADFLTGVYLAFLAIADSKTSETYYNYAVEWQTGWGCSIAGFINVFASELSIVSMFMISIEIYYNAKFAFYGKRMNALMAYGTIVVGYIYCVVVAALPLLGVSSYGASSICLPLSIESLGDQIYITAGLLTTALAFLGMIINYILINLMVRHKNVPSRTEDKQILFRTLVLIGTDMACWLPTLFFGITASNWISASYSNKCENLPHSFLSNKLLCKSDTIWKDAKRKPAKFLEKFSSKHDKTHQSQVTRFFYRHSPNNKDCRSPSSPDEEVTRLLQVTQTTSLNSTPRGSSSSSPWVRLSNGDLVGSQLGLERGPSRTSFQEHFTEHFPCSMEKKLEKKRKSIPSIPIFRLRVSAVPEMSDISESSSNSAEDYDKRTRQMHKASVTSRLAVDDALRKISQEQMLICPTMILYCLIPTTTHEYFLLTSTMKTQAKI
ncbi:Follicle-stimulating hormone receptor [Aphelenchoides bicaudatus]|nr:Follicle-stimulating hormone receptor [Aphelenchoides bicaudatus]